MTHFPLSNAALCEDCGCVGNKLSACAFCGSQSIMLLAHLLNREEKPAVYELERMLWGLETDKKEYI